MKRSIKYVVALAILCMTLIMTACSPKTDVTDPLSDYSVDINVPFSTNSPSDRVSNISDNSTATQKTAERMMGWLNESIDSSVQNSYSELRLNSLGTGVKNLQKRLIELGYMTGTASGTFDQATAQAVRMFEASYGRAETGVATRLMQYYLFSDNAKIFTGKIETHTNNANNASFSQLERGDSGAAVTRLQNRLIELGYLKGSATGIFDQNTENAVKDFEAMYGKQRTGIATVSFQTALFSQAAVSASYRTAEPSRAPTPTPTAEPTVSFPSLQKGDKGDAVVSLQARLRQLGYYSGEIDGIYGNATVNAVKKFEGAYGAPLTGVATSSMQKYLYADDARAYSSQTPTPTPSMYSTLSYGSYGDDVARLQNRLKQLNYFSDSADGYYGESTVNAVRAYEARYDRAPTGVATIALQKHLFSNEAKSYSADYQPSAEYTVLSEGSYGTNVYALQSRLIELNYMTGSPDGYYGASTSQAVRAFEAAYSRTQTGIASVTMQETLYSPNAIKNTLTKPAGGTYSRLKNGDKGDDVAKLQQRLIELGYLSGNVDGYFGAGTEKAVEAFEAAYGIAPTGIASPALQSYLFAKTAKRNPYGEVAVSYSSLEDGDTGESVRKLQNRLIELGYLRGSADGVFGSGTENAVKAFQGALGLKKTGVASAALQSQLFSEDAPANVTPASPTTVNKPAFVSVERTNVYKMAGDVSPVGTISFGTQVSILRTLGEWAEIQNSSGAIGYAMLADFTYAPEEKKETGLSGKIVNVNAQAVVNVNKITVYAYPSEGSEMMGTLSMGAQVTWKRSNGAWAEILNSQGYVGYVYGEYLSIVQNVAPKTSAYKTLTTGDTGEKVKNLQRRLKELGYFNGDIGGNYLTKTTAAVKAFQAAIGMSQTGEATSALQEIIFSSAAPSEGAYKPGTPHTYWQISIGESNEDVGRLQMNLGALGYLNSNDIEFSTFDSSTRSALMDAQLAMGIANADGVASPEIQAFLSSPASAAIKRR